MSVQFGIDASSFQGNVNWAQADSTTSFGWEKVTQGSRKTAQPRVRHPVRRSSACGGPTAAVSVPPMER